MGGSQQSQSHPKGAGAQMIAEPSTEVPWSRGARLPVKILCFCQQGKVNHCRRYFGGWKIMRSLILPLSYFQNLCDSALVNLGTCDLETRGSCVVWRAKGRIFIPLLSVTVSPSSTSPLTSNRELFPAGVSQAISDECEHPREPRTCKS